MAASVISRARQHRVAIFEKRRRPGQKLLIAGSSGLNISNNLPMIDFLKLYSGPEAFWQRTLAYCSREDWLAFIHGLGLETFLGTSGRYFVKEMKALGLLNAWRQQLTLQNVAWQFAHEFTDFEPRPGGGWQLKFAGGRTEDFDAVCFGLGGGSYEPKEKPLRWPPIFLRKGLRFKPFTAANAGYQVAWPAPLLAEAEGLPLKNVELKSSRGTRRGDLVITSYGIEGTPVYFFGESGTVTLDLKPDMTVTQILERCASGQENLAPMRRVKRYLNLCPGSLAVLFHLTPRAIAGDLPALAERIKALPVMLGEKQSLDEAISAAGGLELAELDDRFMLKRFPGLFAAGEMLDWDAPTGGFLIQGCVSQGAGAGQGILDYLKCLV